MVAVACISYGVASLETPWTDRWLASNMVDSVVSSNQVALPAYQTVSTDGGPADTLLSESILDPGGIPLQEETMGSPAEISETAFAGSDESVISEQGAGGQETLEGQAGTVALQFEASLLSVDVTDISPTQLFKDLAKRCNVDIFSPEVLEDKVISANFRNGKLAEGIKTLLRISGVANYALIYRSDVPGRSTVSQIFFFPGSSVDGDGYPTGEISPLTGAPSEEGAKEVPGGSWT